MRLIDGSDAEDREVTPAMKAGAQIPPIDRAMTRTSALPSTVEREIATRRFTVADQADFAAMSGDFNPMHMDPLAARRTQAGEPVVHGMHALLWVLDSAAAAGIPLETLRQIKVQFGKFMYLERTLSLRHAQSDPASARFVLRADGMRTMAVLLRFGPRSAGVRLDGSDAVVAAGRPRRSGWQKWLTGRAGSHRRWERKVLQSGSPKPHGFCILADFPVSHRHPGWSAWCARDSTPSTAPLRLT